jgi:AmmeMemoRadiSam system radical SAM enzyme/AmmeMemoRadiSam system protein B/AmmeMemoRadiSam system protein A
MALELPLLAPPTSDQDHLLPGRWWHAEGHRIVCDLCPRACALKEGDRGFCFVRQNLGGRMMLTTYGRSTGFCIDPIEKKPLNHFYPGTSVLSFGTAGCNLGCKFCQNWDISKSREVERLSERAFPEDIAGAAQALGCRSVAFTYNDPVVWAEYAIETAKACRARGINTVAVTAGYITREARDEFYEVMDAANVDLKGFTEDFYKYLTLSHLEPVLETLRWLKHETDVWFEITNLVIPDANDSAEEFRQMCDWVLGSVGDEVPVHFTAFHPDYKLMDRPRTPAATLNLAREIALAAGLKYVYTGNVDDVARQSTYCPGCGKVVIERNWYELGDYALDGNHCRHCGNGIAGHFDTAPGAWGRRRQSVDMRRFATRTRPTIPPSFTSRDTMTTTQEATVQAPQQPELTEQQQQALLQAAGEYVKAASLGRQPALPDPDVAGLATHPVAGVFVSLKRNGKLRACCGSFGRTAPLRAALQEAAVRSATSDHRFPPVSPGELPFLDLEVWLLYAPEQVQERGADRVDAVTVGRHGLQIVHGEARGLLLPGVPVDNEWTAEEFLHQVCIKAGLTPTAWKDDSAVLYRFEGVSFRQPQFASGEQFAPTRPLYTTEQLALYRQFYGDVIASLLRGTTPMFYCATVSDCNANGVVVRLTAPGSDFNLTASRISVLELVPLQSTLFAMCQELAATLQQHRVQARLQLDLAVLHDPCMHGTAAEPDLGGHEPNHRSLLVAERGRTGWMFDPSQTGAELLQTTSEVAGVSEPEAAQVISFATLATADPIQVRAGPRAQRGPDVRPAAVAGKFYPGDVQEMTALVDEFLAETAPHRRCSAVMVPHAGWIYSGRLAADVLKRTDFPRTVIALGPKHTSHGVEWAVAPHSAWALPGEQVESDPELARQLAAAIPGLQLDAAAHQLEHGIEVELPFIARLAPQTRVVGITIGGGSLQRCEQFAEGLAAVLRRLDERPLLLISTDMNHFATDAETRRLDALALQELDRLDPDALYHVCRRQHISMCGLLPAVIVLKTLRQLGALQRSERIGYSTTADTTGDGSRVVGYAGMIFE